MPLHSPYFVEVGLGQSKNILDSKPACIQPSKGFSPAKYRLYTEEMPAIICKFRDWPIKAIVTVHMYSVLDLYI